LFNDFSHYFLGLHIFPFTIFMPLGLYPIPNALKPLKINWKKNFKFIAIAAFLPGMTGFFVVKNEVS